MNEQREGDHKPHGAKENLLGNGTLTVAARLMSVAGVPIAAFLFAVIGYFANLLLTDVREELKANRTERQAVATIVGEFKQRFAEVDRRNDQQDRYIDALRDRERPRP